MHISIFRYALSSQLNFQNFHAMLPGFIRDSVLRFLQIDTSAKSAELYSIHALSGGSINQAFRLKTSRGDFFLKYNDASRYPEMFRKEAEGLKLLKAPGIIEVPGVLLAAEDENHAFLLLEFVDQGIEKPDFWDDFGEKLARLHQVKAQQFGLDHDNYMGSLYQYNHFHDTWSEFFIVERLERQIKLAREQGNIKRSDVQAFERLYLRLDEIFPPCQPSLLHGDLWSGNFITSASGFACLIDPAVYFGHPETDIAMSTLFGGFSNRFYEAYASHNVLEKGWRERLPVYNLYPLMVHVNLFGGGYLGSVQQILKKF